MTINATITAEVLTSAKTGRPYIASVLTLDNGEKVILDFTGNLAVKIQNKSRKEK